MSEPTLNLSLPVSAVGTALGALNQLIANAQNAVTLIQQQANSQLTPPAEAAPAEPAAATTPTATAA